MEGMYTKETAALAMHVADGNPGAIRVIKELEWYSHWYDFMRYLKAMDITGSKVWEIYKDIHKQDIDSMAKWLETVISGNAWRRMRP